MQWLKSMGSLSEIGLDGLDILASSHVTVIGAGGLGCPVIMYLAAMGVGHIHVVDGDRVEQSNLSRQILYCPEDIGHLKTEALKGRFNRFYPHTMLSITSAYLTIDSAPEIFANTQVVVDASDNFATNYLVNDIGQHHRVPVVYGAVSQWSGQAATFLPSRPGCLRCIHPAPPKMDIPNCSSVGVLSSLAGMVGTFQASEVIKILLSMNQREKDDSHGQMNLKPSPFFHIFDLLNSDFLALNWSQKSNCYCRSPHLDPMNSDYLSGFCSNLKETPNGEFNGEFNGDLSENIFDRMAFDPESKKNVGKIVIDVRELMEKDFQSAEIIRIPFSQLDPASLCFPLDTKIQLICSSGKRALKAALILRDFGFKNAFAYPNDLYDFHSSTSSQDFHGTTWRDCSKQG